jgi:hypothetical protein
MKVLSRNIIEILEKTMETQEQPVTRPKYKPGMSGIQVKSVAATSTGHAEFFLIFLRFSKRIVKQCLQIHHYHLFEILSSCF